MDRTKNKGFTIVELLVAMTVFLIVVAISSGIFIRTIKTQRIVTNMSASLNNVTLALEQIAREARTGYNFTPPQLTTSELTFTNAQGERVTYDYLSGEDSGTGKGVIRRQIMGDDFDPITSEEINITRLQFNARTAIGELEMPTLITIDTTVKAEGDIEVYLQTSVSSRILKI